MSLEVGASARPQGLVAARLPDEWMIPLFADSEGDGKRDVLEGRLARHPTQGFRVAAAVLSALTTVEVVWALTYLAVTEEQPWIWLFPCLGFVAVLTVSLRLVRSPRMNEEAVV